MREAVLPVEGSDPVVPGDEVRRAEVAVGDREGQFESREASLVLESSLEQRNLVGSDDVSALEAAHEREYLLLVERFVHRTRRSNAERLLESVRPGKDPIDRPSRLFRREQALARARCASAGRVAPTAA